jgi:hypothetical protein
MGGNSSNIVKIILVIAILAIAGYFLYPYVMQATTQVTPETDPFGEKFEKLNSDIAKADSISKVNSLYSEVSALKENVSGTKYTKYLALADAQLSVLSVVNASLVFDSEQSTYLSKGVNCSRDYSSLLTFFSAANSTKAAANSSLNTYVSNNPNSTASVLIMVLEGIDTDGMYLFAELIPDEQEYLCLKTETPAKAYTLPLNESEAALLAADEVWSSGAYIYSIGESLPSGSEVSVKRLDGTWNNRTLDSDTWFFMIDESPSALWSHEVKFVFIDAKTANYSVSDEAYYPVIDGISYWSSYESRMNETWVIYPENSTLDANASTSPKSTLYMDGHLYTWPLAIASVPAGTDCSKIDCCEGVGKDKALVVAGNDEKLFHNDAGSMYTFLKAGRKMSAGDITYLTAKSGVPESDGVTNLASLKAALEALAKDTECCDRVFIYLTGHGNNITMWLYKNKKTGRGRWFARGPALALNRSEWDFGRRRANFHHIDINPYEKEKKPDGKVVERGDKGGGFMWAEDIGAMLDKIKSCYVTLMYDSCHSGPAAPWLAGRGRTVMTTSNVGSSWGIGGKGVFNTQWIYAQGMFADEADTNNDGKVTDKEAFDYANKETKHKVKKKTGKDQSGTWTDPKPPCVCCDVPCNASTNYYCVVTEGNGTISPLCKKVGDYCGPTITDNITNVTENITTPNITENGTPGTGGGITVGGGENLTVSVCGDGNKTGTEQCEADSDCPKYRYCDKKTCVCKQYPLICGDGKIAAGEECDPQASPTGCTEGLVCDGFCICREPANYCGDGILSATEECDVGIGCDTGYTCDMGSCTCEESTEPPPTEGYCGDGKVEGNEECESASDCGSGYSCTNCLCVETTTCGDGEITGSEECDPNASPTGCDSGYSCASNCKCVQTPTYCGDGEVNGAEECDPNASPTGCGSGEGCTGDCRCIGPPDPDCESACAQLTGSTLLGEFSDAGQCTVELAKTYWPGKTCYVNCWWVKALGYGNVAGYTYCCCGIKKEFPCDDCPGENPYCDESLCAANKPSWMD